MEILIKKENNKLIKASATNWKLGLFSLVFRPVQYIPSRLGRHLFVLRGITEQ